MTGDDYDQENSIALRKSLEEDFGEFDDYRRKGSVRHLLIDILFITICAVISGANNLKAVAVYAKHKQGWLTELLGLLEGSILYYVLDSFCVIKLRGVGKMFCEMGAIKSQIERRKCR